MVDSQKKLEIIRIIQDRLRTVGEVSEVDIWFLLRSKTDTVPEDVKLISKVCTKMVRAGFIVEIHRPPRTYARVRVVRVPLTAYLDKERGEIRY